MLVFRGVMVTMKRNHLGEIQKKHWDELAGIVLQNVCMSSFEPAPSGAFEVLIQVCDYKGKGSILPCHSGTSEEWNFVVLRRVDITW